MSDLKKCPICGRRLYTVETWDNFLTNICKNHVHWIHWIDNVSVDDQITKCVNSIKQGINAVKTHTDYYLKKLESLGLGPNQD